MIWIFFIEVTLLAIYTAIHQYQISPNISMVINSWFHDPGGSGSCQVSLEYSFFTDPSGFLLRIFLIEAPKQGPRLPNTPDSIHEKERHHPRLRLRLLIPLYDSRIVSSDLCKRP